MIQAVLKGKSLGYEYTEDILTSTVFGNLRYIRPDFEAIHNNIESFTELSVSDFKEEKRIHCLFN